MNESIKEWYKREYENDNYGYEGIDKNATFMGLFDTLDAYNDVYKYLGEADSIVRERAFQKLAELIDADYEYIYQQWLKCRD